MTWRQRIETTRRRLTDQRAERDRRTSEQLRQELIETSFPALYACVLRQLDSRTLSTLNQRTYQNLLATSLTLFQVITAVAANNYKLKIYWPMVCTIDYSKGESSARSYHEVWPNPIPAYFPTTPYMQISGSGERENARIEYWPNFATAKLTITRTKGLIFHTKEHIQLIISTPGQRTREHPLLALQIDGVANTSPTRIRQELRNAQRWLREANHAF